MSTYNCICDCLKVEVHTDFYGKLYLQLFFSVQLAMWFQRWLSFETYSLRKVSSKIYEDKIQ